MLTSLDVLDLAPQAMILQDLESIGIILSSARTLETVTKAVSALAFTISCASFVENALVVVDRDCVIAARELGCARKQAQQIPVAVLRMGSALDLPSSISTAHVLPLAMSFVDFLGYAKSLFDNQLASVFDRASHAATLYPRAATRIPKRLVTTVP
jgi:hypothetical protein